MLRVQEFCEWLRLNGPASHRAIRLAGFDATFNGQTRQRLMRAGVVEAVPSDVMNPQHGRPLQLYRFVKPYEPPRGGRRLGFRLNDEQRMQAVIRGAITTLRKHGYLVVPPNR